MHGNGRWRLCPRILCRVAVFAVALAVAGTATAQNIGSSNFFAGYSFLGANLFSGEHATLNGWEVSGEKKYLPYFGIVGDVSGLYGSKNLPGSSVCAPGSAGCLVNGSVSEYIFDVGIRGSYATRTLRPFGEALFGEAHTSESGSGLSRSNNGFDAMLGLGMDCLITRLLGCRVDVDYIVTGLFLARHNSIRASTGLVLRF
jgi:hypothetical protein